MYWKGGGREEETRSYTGTTLEGDGVYEKNGK
jgi:hypothetical protein